MSIPTLSITQERFLSEKWMSYFLDGIGLGSVDPDPTQ